MTSPPGILYFAFRVCKRCGEGEVKILEMEVISCRK